MAGQTLETRAKMFHRQFPDKRISPGSLSLLYKRNGIRKTKVYPAKTLVPQHAIKYAIQAEACRTSIREAINDHTPIVYLDETVFTTRTFQ